MYDPAGSRATPKKHRAPRDISTLTQALFIQMLNILFMFPRQPLFLKPTLQTNEDEWLDMNAALKCLIWTSLFLV